MTDKERNKEALRYISDAAEYGDELEPEILIDILSDKPFVIRDESDSTVDRGEEDGA